jgi:hypothetical protein
MDVKQMKQDVEGEGRSYFDGVLEIQPRRKIPRRAR